MASLLVACIFKKNQSVFGALQAENQSTLSFSERTQLLADTLGLSLRELPSYIGISPAMLFGYRSGKHRVSRKALAKLTNAEIRAISERRMPAAAAGSEPGSMKQWVHQEFVKRVSPDDPLFAQLEALVNEQFGDQIKQLDQRAEELRKRSERLEAMAGRVDATLEKLERIVSKYGLSESDVQEMIAAEIARGRKFVVTPERLAAIGKNSQPKAKSQGLTPPSPKGKG